MPSAYSNPVLLYKTAEENVMSTSKRARTVLILTACALFITAIQMQGQAVNGTLLGTLTDSDAN
jgi:hypothetical protein